MDWGEYEAYYPPLFDGEGMWVPKTGGISPTKPVGDGRGEGRPVYHFPATGRHLEAGRCYREQVAAAETELASMGPIAVLKVGSSTNAVRRSRRLALRAATEAGEGARPVAYGGGAEGGGAIPEGIRDFRSINNRKC